MARAKKKERVGSESKPSMIDPAEAWQAIEEGRTIDGRMDARPKWTSFIRTGRPSSGDESVPESPRKEPRTYYGKRIAESPRHKQTRDNLNAYHRAYYAAHRERIKASRQRKQQEVNAHDAPVVHAAAPAAPAPVVTVDKKRLSEEGKERMRKSRGTATCIYCLSCLTPKHRYCWYCGHQREVR